MKSIGRPFLEICRMIKIEHSVFALPYAWSGAFLAARGVPPILSLLWLTIAMVGIRSFAMTCNRILDKEIDTQNPRTANRPLVTGSITVFQAWVFCVGMAAVFVLACAMLNYICLVLSLPALIFAGVYSILKRFTRWCHFWLGATLGLAPLAGWLAVQPTQLDPAPVMLFFAVTFWVAAFDIYYAFQDQEIDRKMGLHSIPADQGAETAMALAGFAHILTVIFLFLAGLTAHLSWPWYIICALVAALLIFEHRLVNPDDLSHVNTAFFTLNSIISPTVLVGIILGIYL